MDCRRFSLICHVYFVALRPRSFGGALDHPRGRGAAIVALAFGGVWPLLRRAVAGGVIVAEYPSYATWPLGVTVCAALAALNTLAAFRDDDDDDDDDDESNGGRRQRGGGDDAPDESDQSKGPAGASPRPPPPCERRVQRAAAVGLMGLLVALPGLLPYAGVRTYPALAMFSNLRLEDPRGGNHWLLPGWHYHRGSGHGGTSGQGWRHAVRGVRVVATDIEALRHFEVDLARWYPAGTGRFLSELGVDAVLWVCPPPGAWTPPPADGDGRSDAGGASCAAGRGGAGDEGAGAEQTRVVEPADHALALEVPFVELRRAVAARARGRSGGNATDAFVIYHDSADGPYDAAPPREWRVVGGVRVAGDAELQEPWPWLFDQLFRFRSFTSDASPCRH